ncbi:hypothetical protein Ahy_B03g067702 [Arachis hypogaea]|uniref:Uncharacterized protein n=1 Tax=Arachis hypogaea TaxID=3818 RepID=A0A445A7W8_ARAHY|nr:hypothetical protein Ahy_B03g067702 [Arachis hypogaea]
MEFLSLNVENQSALPPKPSLLRQIIVVASIAVSVQFGWALQLSLQTPLRPSPWYPTGFRSLHLILQTNNWDAHAAPSRLL